MEERLDKQGNRIHQLETQDLSRMIREQTVEYIDKQEIDRKIKEMVKEVVTASVQYAMRAPLRARFKDLPTSDMKEILLQRMLEENYDKGHEDHRIAYEALQKSILRDESEQFDADKAEERKKMKSKQDSPETPPGSPHPPPPPLPPSGPSGASGITGASDSAQDPLPPPSSLTTNQGDQSQGSDAPGSSKIASDIEAQDLVFDDEDIGSRHIPKVSLNQEWFKPLSEEERPATPKPAWSIPSSSLPVPINNWASVIASSYVPPPENSLLSQTVLRRADNQEYTIAENDFKDLYPSDFEDLYLLNLQGHLNHLPPRDKKIISSAVNLWIRNLVIRQRVEDFQLGIESYQTQLNLTKPRWEATGLEFMHDYKILDSPRVVVFRDKYGMQMIMRFNEIHKFSDGTLQQIDEALDYRVKEFRVNKVNPRLNTRFWTTNDVIKSKQFMFAIQKRLKLRRIFRNLESFVGGRIREGDYRLLQRTE
ncbi:hypothetical protein Tco_0335794 [Tanacetum coccineum]